MAGINWRDQAQCLDTDPELWHPTAPGPHSGAAMAKRICGRCPVRQTCLEHALSLGDIPGIWGGQSQAARMKMLAKMPKICLEPGCEEERSSRHGKWCGEHALAARRRTSAAYEKNNPRHERIAS